MKLRDYLDTPLVLTGLISGIATYLVISGRDKRQKVVNIAKKEAGNSNWTKYLDSWGPYTVAENPGRNIYWCGVFSLWALHKAGLGENIQWRYSAPHGFLFRLPRTSNPKPGDLGYIKEKQHHAIVEKVQGDWVFTIDGNSDGGKVVLKKRPKSSFAAFYSIQPLLDGKIL